MRAVTIVSSSQLRGVSQGHPESSNPDSGGGFPKTGIFQISAGDYQRFRSHSGRFIIDHMLHMPAEHGIGDPNFQALLSWLATVTCM
jgi:hypothetical protein